jgi:hypothetical protein
MEKSRLFQVRMTPDDYERIRAAAAAAHLAAGTWARQVLLDAAEASGSTVNMGQKKQRPEKNRPRR